MSPFRLTSPIVRRLVPADCAAFLFLLLALSVLAPVISSAQQPAVLDRGTPIRALYITGGGFHDFVAQEKIIPPGIAARAPVEWTIDHTAGTSTDTLIARHRDTRWADEFEKVI